MIRHRGLCLLLIASGGILASPAQAQDDVDPFVLSPEQLFGAEVISASRSPESIWDAPAAIYVLTADDIARSGATSIVEALRLVPGVQVARINTSGWAVSVRGFNSPLANKLLVLIDGRETYDPLFSGVYWDVQDTPLQDIERIEVVRGPGASLWGANAVNGVINIITRDASETQGAMVSAIAGDHERAGLTARYGGAIGSHTHWRAYGRMFDRGPQETLGGEDDASEWEAWRGGFRVDSDLSPRDTLTLQGDIYRSETGQFRQVSSLSAPFISVEREHIVADGANVLARWTHNMGGDTRFTAQAYLDVTRRDQRTLRDERTTLDLDLQYEFGNWGGHDLIAGLRYRRTSDDVVSTEIIRSADNTHESDLLSVFVQDEIALAGAWRLTLGSKFDNNDYTGIEIQPNARLQWTGERQTVWTAVSRAVRSPSELDREFDILLAAGPPFPMSTLPLSIELLPSPEFESEDVIAYELGYRRQITPELAVDVALFRNEYENLATLTPLAPMLGLDPPRLILIPILTTNDSEATAQGGELVADWRPLENVGVSFAYSYVDLDVSAPAGAIDGEAAEGRSPHNQANLRINWDASDVLAFDATLYYVDELTDFGIEDYLRADLRVALRVAENVHFEVIGQNLMDDSHREFTSPSDVNAAEIGRSVFGRLTWRR
jgi:iron complex outermembrane recepter protein